MFTNNFLYLSLLLTLHLGICGSDRGIMRVTVTNNTNFPTTNVELKNQLSQVNIIIPRNDIQNTTFQIKIDNETSKIKTLKAFRKYDQTLWGNLKEVLEDMIHGSLANQTGAYHITQADNKSEYKTFSDTFNNLISYHWTILPSGAVYINTLKLEYPKGTTALALKKNIYAQLKALDTNNDQVIQHKMFNILIKQHNVPLKDESLVPDIDEQDIQEAQTFALEMNRTSMNSHSTSDKVTFNFVNPPISIGSKPSSNIFEITLEQIDQNDIKIKINSADYNDLPTAVSSDASFIDTFDRYVMSQQNRKTLQLPPEPREHLTLFRGTLVEWAKKNNTTVTFQAEQLYSPQVTASAAVTAVATPTLKTESANLTWSTRPTTFHIHVKDISLNYPENTTVGKLKNIIYETLEKQVTPDLDMKEQDINNYNNLKDRFYDIVIKRGTETLSDDFVIPNIDALETTAKNQYILKLIKKFKWEHGNNPLTSSDTKGAAEVSQAHNGYPPLETKPFPQSSSSWFSSNWQLPKWDSLKNWFRAKAGMIVAATAGIFTIGALTYKHHPNWFQNSWFKPQTPNMSAPVGASVTGTRQP